MTIREWGGEILSRKKFPLGGQLSAVEIANSVAGGSGGVKIKPTQDLRELFYKISNSRESSQ